MKIQKELKKKTKNLIEFLREHKEKIPKISSVLTTDTEKKLYIQLKFEQNFLKNKNPILFTKNLVLNKKKDKVKKINTPSNSQSKEYFLETQCPSNDQIILRGKTIKKKNYFEIWENDKIRSVLEITSFFEFLYLEDVFGYLEWNEKGDKVIFCAEKKLKEDIKFENIFEEKFDKNYDDYLEQRDNLNGFTRPVDNRFNPVIFLFDLKKNQIFEVENCENKNYFALSPIFYGNGIVFVGLFKDHFKYSNDFCYNRPKSLYFLNHLKLKAFKLKKIIGKDDKIKQNNKFNEEKKPIKITSDVWTVFDPFFSDDKSKLYFTGRKEEFYEHDTCYQLFQLNFKDFLTNKKSCSELIIDVVNENTDSFNGIYKIINDFGNIYRIKNFKNNIIINTAQKGRNIIYYFDTKENKLIKHPIDNGKDSFNILSQTKDYLIIKKTSENILSEIIIVEGLTNKSHTLNKVEYNEFENIIYLKNYISSFKKSTTKLIKLENRAEGLLYLSESSKTKKQPLIVCFHGGPFSYTLMIKNYTPFYTMFLKQGFNILEINYRGSTSYGLNKLSSLIKNGGKVDINDSMNIIKKTLELYKEEIDDKNVGVYGWSHGGFLTGWMITHPEFCKYIKCSVIYNGVLHGPAMLSGSTIPEWTYAVFNTDRKIIEWPISCENLVKVYKMLLINKKHELKIDN